MTMSYADACATVCAPGTMFEILEADVFGVPTKVFAGTPPNIRALYDAAATRTDDFVVYDGPEFERWPMARVLEQAGQIGHALVHEFDIQKGDRVAIAMRNFPEWITSYVAITSIGAVVVPLNAWWQKEELHFALVDSGSKAVLVDAERLERLEDALTTDTQIITVRCPESSRPRLEDALVDGTTMPDVDIDLDDDISILYTSGTTGNPKGAVSTHRGVLSALLAFAARGQVATLRTPDDPHTPPSPPSCFILAVPLFHVTGLVPVMLGSFVGGSRLVIMHRWDAGRALELIEQEQVTNFVGVPTMSWDLLEHPSFAATDTSSLRSVGGGGAPMPPELVKRIEDNFPNGRPGLGYGMTETNAYGPQNSGDDFLARPSSTGRTVPIMEVRVTDPEGRPLPTGETGEIWFRGPNLIRCYWNRPEATADTIVDGWLRTGDIGRIDEEGFVYVSDRAKDMVLRAGENVYSAEVEAAIYEHPAVYEAAVYGLPHERLGEEVAAHVMIKEPVTVEELQAFVAERLAKFKVPTHITLVEEPLPRNASGKILKRELRDSI